MSSETPQMPGNHTESETAQVIMPITPENHDSRDNDLPGAGVTTLEGDSATGFAQQVAQYQKELEEEFRSYAKALEQEGHDNELSDMDWDNLQHRYREEMADKIRDEEEIIQKFSAHFQAR
jgi:hypothetical protein